MRADVLSRSRVRWLELLALGLAAAGCALGGEGVEQPVIDEIENEVSSCPPEFTDVPGSYWAAAQINTGACLGVTGGCGADRFCPERPLTRGEAALFIVRAYFGEDFSYSTTPWFPEDIPSEHPLFKYIQKMKDAGIADGCASDAFCVNDPVTNLDAAVFLQRAHYGCDTCFAAGDPPAYTDVSDPSDEYYEHIQRMRYDLGWTNMGKNEFSPARPATRAQMMYWLYYRKKWTPWCAAEAALQDPPGAVAGALETYFAHPAVQAQHLDCRTSATGDTGNEVSGRLVSSLWQRTASANDFPITWDVGDRTGLSVGGSAVERFVHQRGAEDVANTTALQMKDDMVGVYLTGAADQSASAAGAAHFDFPTDTDHRPFAGSDSELAYIAEWQIPVATRTGAAEVHAAAVFRFKDRRAGNEGRQFSFSIQAFDLRPPQPETAIMDDCPVCSSEVVAVTRFGSGLQYGHLGAESHEFTQTPWTGWRLYDFRINAVEFSRALRDVKCEFALSDTQLSPDPADYQLVHVNWSPETDVPEGTTATLAASVRNIRIARFSSTGPTSSPVYDRVIVNAANDVHSPAAASLSQVFFITEDDPVWDEKKSLQVNLPNTGGNLDLTFDFSGNACWKGTVTGIRFDPFDCTNPAQDCNNACFNVSSISVRSASGAIYPGMEWLFSGPQIFPIPNPYQGWGWSSLARTWADGNGYWGACVGPSPNGPYGDPQTARADLAIATGR